MSDIRRRILDAAIEVLREHGLTSLSFREAARRAGVSHQAPYHFFGNRDGILAALAEEGFRGLEHALSQAKGADAIGTLRQVGRAYVSFARAYPAHYQLMFRAQPTNADPFPNLLAAERATRERMEAVVHQLRESGVALDQDPAELVTLIWSTLHVCVTLTQAGPLARNSSPGTEHRAAQGAVNALTDLVIRAYT